MHQIFNRLIKVEDKFVHLILRYHVLSDFLYLLYFAVSLNFFMSLYQSGAISTSRRTFERSLFK